MGGYSLTTTSYDDVTTAAQSSSGSATAWVLSGVTSSTTNSNYVDLTTAYRKSKWLDLSIPDFMAAIGAGAEFISLNVKFKAYDDDTADGDYTFSVRQNGVQTFTTSVSGTSTSFKTYSGDKTYWGFTGTVQQIFADLADGDIKFRFYAQAGISPMRCDMEDFQIQLVYSAPDTRRASILTCIP